MFRKEHFYFQKEIHDIYNSLKEQVSLPGNFSDNVRDYLLKNVLWGERKETIKQLKLLAEVEKGRIYASFQVEISSNGMLATFAYTLLGTIIGIFIASIFTPLFNSILGVDKTINFETLEWLGRTFLVLIVILAVTFVALVTIKNIETRREQERDISINTIILSVLKDFEDK